MTKQHLHFWKIPPSRKLGGAAVVLALLGVLKWCWDGVQFIGPIPPAGPPKIVYLSCRMGHIWGEIYSMNLDGSEKTLLLTYPLDRTDTRHNVHLEAPVIRPDRRSIAFYIRRQYQQSIWTMNLDGSGQNRLTPWVYIAARPRFTADGRNIVFGYLVPEVTDNPANVYVMNTKGKRWRHIRDDAEKNIGMQIQQLLNPEGPWLTTEIAMPGFIPPARRYSSIVHADGQTFPLPEIAQRGREFSLSPDRSTFLFSAGQIYRINTDATGLTRLTSQLTPRPTFDLYPKFTPDGQQIVFISNRDGNDEIYIMNADGTNQRNLTTTALNESWFDVR